MLYILYLNHIYIYSNCTTDTKYSEIEVIDFIIKLNLFYD